MTLLALPAQVALVDETGRIGADELAKMAGALNEQAARDFAPVWHVRAAVVPLQQPPPNMWAIRIRDRLDEPGALGYHTDDHNQPVSYVLFQSPEETSVTCSHELLEMLADPWGNRMHGGRLPRGFEDRHQELGLKHPTTHVSYLLEVCDPPEATSYDIGGIAVSDFIYPSWYHADRGAQFSYSGACQHSREVAGGGYVSFCVGDHWYQVTNWGRLDLHDLGRFDKSSWSSLREFTDHHARIHREEAGSR
jgi:hypothetical protein